LTEQVENKAKEIVALGATLKNTRASAAVEVETLREKLDDRNMKQ